MLSAEELLAGSKLTFEIQLPADILSPGKEASSENFPQTVKLRPLTVNDLQLVLRAAKESDNLVAVLMVQRALVEPKLTVSQAMSMHIGLMQFLLEKVNQISGIETSPTQLSMAMEAPLSKAAFILAKEFGWTPQQVNELTLGQVLLHMQMLKEKTKT